MLLSTLVESWSPVDGSWTRTVRKWDFCGSYQHGEGRRSVIDKNILKATRGKLSLKN